MLTIIRPSVIKGIIQAPASKSSMQRACAAALLNGGETIIKNPGYSNDDKAALGVIKALGATVDKLEDGSLKVASAASFMQKRIHSPGNGPASAIKEVNCGESGLGIRMFAPIIALSDQAITVNGEGSLLSRPMDFFDEIFPQLGIKVVSNKGKLPLQIQGPLQPRNIEIDGSLSSQFLTGLLMSFAAAGAEDVSIKVNNLKSKPYIDLTLQVMRHFGWEVENRGYKEFYFQSPIQHSTLSRSQCLFNRLDEPPSSVSPLTIQHYTVEGDWSGGAFLLVAGAIAGKVTVKGLDTNSTQADRAILQALSDCGAFLSVREEQIEIGPRPGSKGPGPASPGPDGSGGGSVGQGLTGSLALKAFRFNAQDCPDLFPPLVALASFCEGTTVIEGVGRLAHKESNRALTLQEEFGKMGVVIQLQDDRMLVKGGGVVTGATVHSRHDHRIAMACAVAGLRAGKETIIEEAQAINKSYPDFYEHLRLLGADVKIQQEIGNVQ